jgi:hypothetical protein
MSESTGYERYGKPLVRAVVIFLITVSLFASYSLLSSESLTPAILGDVAVTLYISGLVFYGVFWGTMDSRRYRVAVYFGVVLWGGERFLSGNESVLTLALLLGGMAMVVRELYFTE